MYEGEWVNDNPKCGEFRDPHPDELSLMGHSAVFQHKFDMPELALKGSRALLDTTIASTRLERSIRQGILNSGIDREVIARAEQAFIDLDTSGSGSVEYRYLGSVFSILGIFLTPDDLAHVMSQFNMENITDLSFPEVIEIASFLLENNK